MSEFLDGQAVESDEERSDTEQQPAKKRSKKTVQSDDDDDDGDEDEQQIAEEMAGFVVEPDEEEEEGNDAASDKSKDSDSDDEVEEEDLDLIKDNLGISPTKKANRVRIEDSDEEGDAEDADRRRIAADLFDGGPASDDEDAPAPRATPAPRPEPDSGSDSGSEVGEEPWLVDEEGRAIKPSRRHRTAGASMSNAQLEEAREIFGVDFDYDDFVGDAGEEEEEEEGEEELEEDEFGERRVVRKRRTPKQSLLGHIEPSELADGFLGDADKRIQLEDRPERFQLRKVPVTEAAEEELSYEADWIYNNAFVPSAISDQTPQRIFTMVDHGEYQRNAEGKETFIQFNKSLVQAKIQKTLEYIRNEQFEVPFIAFYRKEYIEPELGLADLWRIYEFDERCCQLLTRRRHLGELFERMSRWQAAVQAAAPEAPLPDDIRLIDTRDFEMVRNAHALVTLGDIAHYFDLYHGVHIHKLEEWERTKAAEEGEERPEPLKKPIRKDPYHVCVSAGLAGFAAKFGLRPHELAENLEEGYTKHEVESYGFHPEETARDYVSEQFEDPEKVLLGAKFMVAKELSREPRLRAYLRAAYFERAMLSTKITKKGRKEIDENHPIYTQKYLKNKPVKQLGAPGDDGRERRDEFLRLVQAEENGLIQICLHADYALDESKEPFYALDLASTVIQREFYRKDAYSDAAKAWNQLRDETLEMAINEMLAPVFAKELRTKLVQEARDAVIRSSAEKLYKWLEFAPFTPDLTAIDDEEEIREALLGTRVLGVAYSSARDEAAFCAMLDHDGEMVDHLRLCHLLKRRRSNNPEWKRLKEQDMEYFKKFVRKRRPHIVAVAAENLDALMIRDDLEEALKELASSGGPPPVPVEIVDNELALLYANSKRAARDFPDLPARLREAISLARRTQDPLAEVAQMWTPEEELLCLNFHPLMSMVPKEDLAWSLQVELINRVNEVGVDINRCLNHPHYAGMVQFTCGFGPRKANMILKILKQNEFLENRTRFVTLCKMGSKVFMNCAGFVKIDGSKFHEEQNVFLEPLDGTRIHPETYEWARKMAVDALEMDDGAEELNATAALEEIFAEPEKLKELDLDAFAEELERQNFGKKATTLFDIQHELKTRYKDLRPPLQLQAEWKAIPEPDARDPDQNLACTAYRQFWADFFNLITKETPATFNTGKLVLGRVLHIVYRRANDRDRDDSNPLRDDNTGFWQCSFCHRRDFPELSNVWTHLDSECPGQAMGVKVKLENGLLGYLPTNLISDSQVRHPEDRLKIGMPLYCRVTEIKVKEFNVRLTCRSSDLADREGIYRPHKDRYYDHAEEEADRREEERHKTLQARTNYVKRVIAHPNFRNVSFKEAEKILETMDQGDCIIRPSSKGTDHLTVTWKICAGICSHIDVREEGKEKAFSLGKQLWIGEEEFEDLDEIVARFVQPMAALARDILNFKYFGVGIYDKEAVELRLQDEKNRNQSRIPYLITASKALPGKFLLSYLPRAKVRHEYLTVVPEGYKFRRVVHASLPALMKWFKDHFRDPVPGGSPGHTTPGDQSSYNAAQGGFDAVSRVSGTPAHSSFAGWNPQQMPPPPMGMGVPPPPGDPFAPMGDWGGGDRSRGGEQRSHRSANQRSDWSDAGSSRSRSSRPRSDQPDNKEWRNQPR